jgi:hypothetical protein
MLGIDNRYLAKGDIHMPKFDYNNLSFSLPKKGSPGEFDSYQIKDFISEDDLYYIEGVNKPILTRSAITKLYRGLGFTETEIKVETISTFPTKINPSGITIFATVSFNDDIRAVHFIGDGEASTANLSGNIEDGDSISLQYPIAMAIKRARSRAVLNYLGIDAYGEDEAPKFSRVKLDDLSERDLKSLEEITAKRKLIDYISESARNQEHRLEKNELGIFVRNVLGLPENTKLTLKSLNFENLIKIVVALELNSYATSDTLLSYIEAQNEKKSQ